ncbi:MAG: hypothetical protein WCP31_04625, partial [Chloroflexales bacterium]
GDRLVLPRSDELAYVLQALAELNAYGGQLRPETLGAHLLTLGVWLRANERLIIRYVLQPTREQASPLSLVEMLTINCLLLDMLCDNLKVEATAPVDLLQVMLKAASVEVSDRPSGEQDWVNQIDRAKAIHSRVWVDLMRSIRGGRARACRSQLLKQLNQPQGSSSEIRFLDAATALDVLTQFRKRDWVFRTLPPLDERASPTWKDAGGVYTLIAERLDSIIADELAYQGELLTRLDAITGASAPDAVMKAVEGWLTALSEHGIPHSLGEPPGKGPMLRTLLQYCGTTREEPGRAARAVRLSAGARYVQQAQDFVAYLTKLVDLAQRIKEQQEQQILQLQATSDALRLEERALGRYDAILDLLGTLAPSAQSQEAQP